MRKGQRLFAAGLALAAVAVLTACTGSPAAKPSASITSKPAASASPSATPTVQVPKLDPTGSAEANRDYFDSVNRAQLAANGGSQGRDLIDSLVAAGFIKADMQVTPDKTTIGRSVDSILFSVKIGANCLLGQSSADGYTSSVAPALASGACLIGKTRAIDW